MSDPLEALRGGLVVSVQAPPESPLDGPEVMAAIARAAVAGGAVGIRAEGAADVAAIRAAVDVPIIGLRKRDLPGSPVRITPTVDDAREIVAAGADVLAADATLRIRPDGTATENFIAVLAHTLDVPVLADVDTLDAGLAATAAGAAAVATTLSGYTGTAASDPRRTASGVDPHAPGPDPNASGSDPNAPGPDLPLLRALVAALDSPVLGEGRYGSPAHVRAALDAGAHAVVVGTAITDPFTLTRRFAAAARPEESHVRNG